MDDQSHYDAVLVLIPALLALGGLASAITGSPRGLVAGTVAATMIIGGALFVTPPGHDQDL